MIKLSRRISRSQTDARTELFRLKVRHQHSPIAIPDHSLRANVLRRQTGKISTLYDPRCYGPSLATPGTFRGAVDCAEYLKKLGKRHCRADKDGTVMCTSRGTVVKGFASGGKKSASSYCRDVAHAVVWVLDNCPACGGSNCDIAGMGNPTLSVKRVLTAVRLNR